MPLRGCGRVQRHGGANERLQGRFIDRVALMDIDDAPDVGVQAGRIGRPCVASKFVQG